MPTSSKRPQHVERLTDCGFRVVRSRVKAEVLAGATDAELGVNRDYRSGRFSKRHVPGVSKIAQAIASARVTDMKVLGGGMSSTFTATLADGPMKGKKVMVKERMKGVRKGIGDFYRGPEKAVASQRVCDHLGVKTPRVAVRSTESLGLSESYGESVMVQEFMEDFEPVYFRELSRDEAEQIAVLDHLIGNADRHEGNWGQTSEGELVMIDQDVSFPSSPTWGNAFSFGEGFFGTDMSPELRAKVQSIVDNEADWRKALLDDGLNEREVDAFIMRARHLSEGKLVSPDQRMRPKWWPQIVRVSE